MPRPKKTNRGDGRYEIKRTVAHDAAGRRIVKSFYGHNRDEAENAYRAFIEERTRRDERRKAMFFSAWVEEWLTTYKENDVKPTTYLTTYRRPCKNYILPYFGECFIQDITPADVKAFLNTVRDRSQSMIDKILLCLDGIFETAVDNEIIQKNPARNVSCRSTKEKKKKRTYDAASVNALCAVEHKYALFFMILVRMGLRCSELCGLRWSDVDLERGTLTVEQALTSDAGAVYIGAPKSENSKRRLDVPADLLAKLRAAAPAGDGSTGALSAYVATRRGGNHATPDHFAERELEVFYNAAGVPRDQRLSPHELRHTCGTLLYEQTKDIYFVSRFLGHSDIGITTKIYVHSEMQDEKIHVDFQKKA